MNTGDSSNQLPPWLLDPFQSRGYCYCQHSKGQPKKKGRFLGNQMATTLLRIILEIVFAIGQAWGSSALYLNAAWTPALTNCALASLGAMPMALLPAATAKQRKPGFTPVPPQCALYFGKERLLSVLGCNLINCYQQWWPEACCHKKKCLPPLPIRKGPIPI